jgi:hypothetical protein
MFPCGSVRIVVRRAPIDEAVNEKAVKREPPIVRRLMICLVATEMLAALLDALWCSDSILPFAPVIKCYSSSLVLVQVVVDLRRIIP